MYVNIVAVIAVAVISLVLGFIWYHPAIFGTIWMKEAGLQLSDLKQGPGKGYILTFFASILMAVAMSLLANYGGTRTIFGGIKLGGLVGLGIVATAFVANYVFSQKTLKLFLIDTGYFVINMVIAGIIVSVIR